MILIAFFTHQWELGRYCQIAGPPFEDQLSCFLYLMDWIHLSCLLYFSTLALLYLLEVPGCTLLYGCTAQLFLSDPFQIHKMLVLFLSGGDLVGEVVGMTTLQNTQRSREGICWLTISLMLISAKHSTNLSTGKDIAHKGKPNPTNSKGLVD